MISAAIKLHAPSADLARFVDYYQSVHIEAPTGPAAEAIIPAPRYSLIFQFGEVCGYVDSRGEKRTYPRHFVAASAETPVRVTVGARTDAFRVAMRPHTAELLMKTSARAFRDSAVDIEDVLDRRARSMLGAMSQAMTAEQRVQVFERWLRAHLDESATESLRKMEYAVDRIANAGGQMKIRELAEEMSVSERQLERWFLRTIGLGPKMYQRIVRLNDVLENIRNETSPDWASVASFHGFSDQSHLVRDFAVLAGATPTACHRNAGVMRAVFQQRAARTVSNPSSSLERGYWRGPVPASTARVAA